MRNRGTVVTSEANYCYQRAVQETSAALRAPHSNARRIHLELAESYTRKARSIEAAERRSAFELVSAA